MWIVKDERYPDYSLQMENGGWIPDQEIPDGTLTVEEVADYQRVEALWEAWQGRLGALFQEHRPNTETPPYSSNYREERGR